MKKSKAVMSDSVITHDRPDFSDDMKQPSDKESRYCTRCTRALKACLCDYVERVAHLAPIHILQHPAEVGHPKGTAALLAASLSRVHLHVGESFADADWLATLLADPKVRCAVLWPDETALTLAEAKAQWGGLDEGLTVHFILLDGTWRKAYRMLHSNPALLALPRITLGAIEGQYAIRKKPFAGALSTLEAGYHLLCQWEGERDRFAPLMTLFTQLNRQWQDFAQGRRT